MIGPWIGKSHGRKTGDDGYVNTEKTQYVLLLHGNPVESPWIRVKTKAALMADFLGGQKRWTRTFELMLSTESSKNSQANKR